MSRWTMDNTSATLLERVRNPKDEHAWRTFFELYHPLIARYARMRGLTGPDAEDVAQDCMASLARSMKRFEYAPRSGSFRAYLRKTVNNRVVEMYRRRHPRSARTGELETLASREPSRADWDQVWLREHLAYCVKRVAARYSDKTVRAFQLYALEDWPVDKVCRELGINANQVYLAKTRMVRRLRKEIAQLVGDVL